MPPNILRELLDRLVAALRLFAQGHEHDVVEIAAEEFLISDFGLRIEIRARLPCLASSAVFRLMTFAKSLDLEVAEP